MCTVKKTALMLLLLLTFCLTVAANAVDFRPRELPVKPDKTIIAPGYSHRHVEVKFADGEDIGLAPEGFPVDRSSQVLKSPEALNIMKSITEAGGAWHRMSPTSEELIDELVKNAENNLNRGIADLNNYFILTVPGGVSAEDWIDQLNSLPEVEIALAQPLPMPLPLPDDYQFRQGYLNDAPDGIGAISAWAETGGNGSGCFGTKICDFEYSWYLDHEDIAASYDELIPDGYTPSDPHNDDNHGTAVLGELASFNNSWGTVGASHGAGLWAAPTHFVTHGWQLGTALLHVLPLVYWQPGAVFLIEQQLAGPNYVGPPSQDGLVPVEWYEPWYDIIVTCIGNGVNVVACAGNGQEDLDDAIYSTGNGGHWPFLPQNNSGAIIVGAGAVPAAFGGSDVDRSRLWFSNYGSRVDLQGWGEMVTTTGYGWLYSDDGKDYWYDSSFGGTSSAAPNVASAVAILQSVYKEQGGCSPGGYGTALPPDSARTILKATGTPQQSGTYPATQNIGPRPNLVAAIAALPSQSCCIPPLRGNVDYDPGDNIDISDLVYLVDYMFSGGSEPPCWEEANVDGSGPVDPGGDGAADIDISDLVHLVDYMFNFGFPPAACP